MLKLKEKLTKMNLQIKDITLDECNSVWIVKTISIKIKKHFWNDKTKFIGLFQKNPTQFLRDFFCHRNETNIAARIQLLFQPVQADY